MRLGENELYSYQNAVAKSENVLIFHTDVLCHKELCWQVLSLTRWLHVTVITMSKSWSQEQQMLLVLCGSVGLCSCATWKYRNSRMLILVLFYGFRDGVSFQVFWLSLPLAVVFIVFLLLLINEFIVNFSSYYCYISLSKTILFYLVLNYL